MGSGDRWNANLHAFDRVLRDVPPHARRGLDVGCGEGETARRLRRRVQSVVGIDPHEPSITQARSYGDDIEYVVGDVFEATIPGAPFDVVTACAMLHHVDHRRALERLATLVAPGGTLLVVGLSFARDPSDYARDVWDAITIRRHLLMKREWHTTAPIVWPPPLSYDQVRSVTRSVLPTCDVRRVPYFRYSIVWKRPRHV
ncbi:MAG TPA: class I SAM-dependent methyltransferase [Acidimicrobiales bacterium]|jgi:2-polyprenyl-3-methyl-5-hydroxy-6-metoxy-1,4-benzoquinol methylase|nr:class I SAM-dependent methyltransferase [Acidimicrobiales bacterium]